MTQAIEEAERFSKQAEEQVNLELMSSMASTQDEVLIALRTIAIDSKIKLMASEHQNTTLYSQGRDAGVEECLRIAKQEHSEMANKETECMGEGNVDAGTRCSAAKNSALNIWMQLLKLKGN